MEKGWKLRGKEGKLKNWKREGGKLENESKKKKKKKKKKRLL